ncbi:flagellar hook-associated protein FlgL [Allopusillimonas ginsengisoli]|uniref:flagellar hook-associated protein FlgL n=1 Tax=Allopusillimonas ginsengisoli TaxID=453575 RepID=UPI0010218C11|nr:flagellar hook-associated protein FlgL [Allopusillimonas ginsengisoli]TEA79406.1 flagellar hook-associated protein 3 [Allopusillimonas ginsengisoli]
MRVSSNQFYQTGLHAINSQQSELMHLYKQLGSTKRLITPADDPLAAAQAINISQSQSLNQRLAENRDIARRSLGTAENTLLSMTLLLQEIKTRLIEAGNGTLSDHDRAALGNVLLGARDNLLGLANATDGNGQYLFSGSRGEVAAYQEEAGRIVYCGDQLQRTVQADPTRRIAGSDIGSDILERAVPGSNAYLTRATVDNIGTGRIGAPVITDPRAAQAGHYFTITFTDEITYNVTVTDGLGETVETRENQRYIPDKENTIVLSSGVRVMVCGSPASEDTFFAEPLNGEATRLNIFDTLDSVIAALRSPMEGNDHAKACFSNVLASATQRIGSHYDNVLTVRASVGARMNELDALDDSGSLRDLGYAMHLSNLEGLDYYRASTQLQLRLSALEAASLAFRKIQSTSLFNLVAN